MGTSIESSNSAGACASPAGIGNSAAFGHHAIVGRSNSCVASNKINLTSSASPTSEGQRNKFYKTRLCPYHFKKGSTCKGGDHCSYAHSFQELRPSIDLTKTKVCHEYLYGTCKRSTEECPFAHGDKDHRSFPTRVRDGHLAGTPGNSSQNGGNNGGFKSYNGIELPLASSWSCFDADSRPQNPLVKSGSGILSGTNREEDAAPLFRSALSYGEMATCGQQNQPQQQQQEMLPGFPVRAKTFDYSAFTNSVAAKAGAVGQPDGVYYPCAAQSHQDNLMANEPLSPSSYSNLEVPPPTGKKTSGKLSHRQFSGCSSSCTTSFGTIQPGLSIETAFSEDTLPIRVATEHYDNNIDESDDPQLNILGPGSSQDFHHRDFLDRDFPFHGSYSPITSAIISAGAFPSDNEITTPAAATATATRSTSPALQKTIQTALNDDSGEPVIANSNKVTDYAEQEDAERCLSTSSEIPHVFLTKDEQSGKFGISKDIRSSFNEYFSGIHEKAKTSTHRLGDEYAGPTMFIHHDSNEANNNGADSNTAGDQTAASQGASCSNDDSPSSGPPPSHPVYPSQAEEPKFELTMSQLVEIISIARNTLDLTELVTNISRHLTRKL